MPSRDWTAEHRSGAWSFLSGAAEQNRLALVAALARSHGAGTLVDFGCGAGHLASWLDPDRFERYVGIDITRAAFAGGCEARVATHWVEADVSTFLPARPEPGAVLVFSEILYYLDRPELRVSRLAEAYRSAAVIASMTVPSGRYAHYGERVDAVWRGLGSLGWTELAALTLADHALDTSWRIVVLKADA